jgi:hypothetical protein
MKFQKGMPKPETSGRKPGSKNKKTILRVEEVLSENEVNPTEEILAIIPILDPNEQLKAWGMLLAYIQGKPSNGTPEGGSIRKDENEEKTVLTIEDVLVLTSDIPTEHLITMYEKVKQREGSKE